MIDVLSDHYRCSNELDCFEAMGELSAYPGYFRLDEKTICYGRSSANPGVNLADLFAVGQTQDKKCVLPFDPEEAINNLRLERYVCPDDKQSRIRSLFKSGYYLLRPVLPFKLRSSLKRIWLRGWEKKSFPTWPVDRTVEQIHETLMRAAMKTLGVKQVPFIWFWPQGYSGCLVMTHDVETLVGIDFCTPLMDLDDSFDIKSSFQLVPEGRYPISGELLNEIRMRGFEINVHDWNHDGTLFSNRELFLARAAKINRFAEEHGICGFRSAALYRNTGWYDAFALSYDMSVPNVGHLDPQWGGCCTAMPYLIGRLLEIPVTATQDYMLFHLLKTHSIDLWKLQTRLIFDGNGLASFIVHPDYVIESKARAAYTELLTYLSEQCRERNVWTALPGQVNRWWRNRRQMKLVRKGGDWEIEGIGKERARVAYAILEGETLLYKLPGKAVQADQRSCSLSSDSKHASLSSY